MEDYLVSQFFVDPQVGKPAVPVILITELQDRPLVCVPHSVWNRAVSKRVFPSTALTKPAVVEVKGAYLGDPKVELDFYIKVWIGFWKMELVEELHTHVEECEFDYFFHTDAEGNVVIPFAQSLLAVAQEHFAFFSAAEEVASGVPEAPPEAPEEEELEPGSPGVESRLNQLEKAVKMMTDGMEKLLAGDAQRPQLRPPAIKNVLKQKVTIGGTTVIGGSASFKDPTSKGKAVPPRKQMETQYPHLDIGVVNASLQAGVPHEQLAEMDAMIASNAKAKKVKDMNPAVRLDPLSEMEWDQALAEEQVPGQSEGDGLEADTSDPIAKAQVGDDCRCTCRGQEEEGSNQQAGHGSGLSWRVWGRRSSPGFWEEVSCGEEASEIDLPGEPQRDLPSHREVDFRRLSKPDSCPRNESTWVQRPCLGGVQVEDRSIQSSSSLGMECSRDLRCSGLKPNRQGKSHGVLPTSPIRPIIGRPWLMGVLVRVILHRVFNKESSLFRGFWILVGRRS